MDATPNSCAAEFGLISYLSQEKGRVVAKISHLTLKNRPSPIPGNTKNLSGEPPQHPEPLLTTPATTPKVSTEIILKRRRSRNWSAVGENKHKYSPLQKETRARTNKQTIQLTKDEQTAKQLTPHVSTSYPRPPLFHPSVARSARESSRSRLPQSSTAASGRSFRKGSVASRPPGAEAVAKWRRGSETVETEAALVDPPGIHLFKRFGCGSCGSLLE